MALYKTGNEDSQIQHKSTTRGTMAVTCLASVKSLG